MHITLLPDQQNIFINKISHLRFSVPPLDLQLGQMVKKFKIMAAGAGDLAPGSQDISQ